jgi:uncharacterized protein YbaR (Trm112 family)
MLSHDLLNVLVCPVCKRAVAILDVNQGLVCRPCGLKFPIRDGIPIMLLDEAENLVPCAEDDTAQ